MRPILLTHFLFRIFSYFFTDGAMMRQVTLIEAVMMATTIELGRDLLNIPSTIAEYQAFPVSCQEIQIIQQLIWNVALGSYIVQVA
jgi:hypothetical protein